MKNYLGNWTEIIHINTNYAPRSKIFTGFMISLSLIVNNITSRFLKEQSNSLKEGKRA